MRKRPARFLSACCAALLAVNAAAVTAFAEDEKTVSADSGIIFSEPDDAVLYWATQIGWDKETWTDAPSGFTSAENGFIYICAADSIYKVDNKTGEIASSHKMEGQASYATKGPTYAEGKVFMVLDNGTVEAFDAESLEPLWIYHNKNGGSPTCDIVYNDGRIYTGFWNGEELDADYVCIDITADKADTVEEKAADWEVTNKGGYYWTTAAFTDDYVYIGRDNGVTVSDSEDEMTLLAVDPKTGKTAERGGVLKNDVRSKLVSAEGKLFYTTREGCIYCYDPETDKSSMLDVASYLGLEGYSCTSTPVIANGRAYISLGAPGWDSYNGSLIVVLDCDADAELAFDVAYTLETSAACQAEGVFAGVDEDGYNVVYYVENGFPGTIRVIKDKAGMNEPAETVEEADMNGGKHICPPAIFTPQGEHAQYCAVDPVFDPATGLIYVRYDSFNILAIGKAENAGDIFKKENIIHPNGVATLVCMSDSTPTDLCDESVLDKGVKFSLEKFTADDDMVTATTTADGLYTGSGKKPVSAADYDLLVAENDDQYKRGLAERGDANGDGTVNITDISIIAAHVKSTKAIDKYSLNAADVNNDGVLNVSDISGAAACVKSIQDITEEK